VSEMQLIETLVKQLAGGIRSDSRPHIVRDQDKYDLPGETESQTVREKTPLGHLDDADVLDMVRQSIEENRVDLYLQPIVTLPQRKVKFYEALTRLRGDDGELIFPADYIRVAEPAGIMPMIDNLLLFRCVQVVRRLSSKKRSVGVFCNISPHSLVDADFFPQFVDFMEHNKSLAEGIYFELSQAMVNSIGPIEVESMSALAEHGFRFSLDHVTKLDFDPEELAQRGFKYVKISADLLLSDSSSTGAQIHPADLSDLLARHGITLVVEKIETESAVVNLLDYSVSLGQGYLFSEPKHVRDEALTDIPDRAAFSKVG
ncbi:MAG: EAL domain-containing protein, partial [Fimbriimonadaceae bacterium]|nr:EAL domain-containing protein [Alphaproteobacteria bacterium]